MAEVRRRVNIGTKDDSAVSDAAAAPSKTKTNARSSSSGSSSSSPFTLVSLLLSLVGLLIFVIVTAVTFIVIQNGGIGGDPFPDFAAEFGPPRLPESALEVVADLPSPPGNLAVDANNRVFFTFHPQYNFPTKVAEYLVAEKRWIPFPADQSIFTSVLSVREKAGTLYALDYGNFGFSSTPKVVAIDTATMKIKWTHEFSSHVAGFGSMLNDFSISPDSRYLYIADTSILRGSPALVVLDTHTMRSARAFHSEASLKAKNLILKLRDGPTANKTLQLAGGLLKVRPSVDSIALSTDGSMLFYSSVADTKLYVVPTTVLVDALDGKTTNDEVASAVRVISDKKTSSDGLTTDTEDSIMVSDFENSAINVYPINGQQPYVLVKSPTLLRWPDGFSFGADKYLYVSCSCLQYDMAGLDYKDFGPFQILRVKMDIGGTVGM